MKPEGSFPFWPTTVIAWGLLALTTVLTTVHTDRAARSFDACVVPPNTIPGLPEPRFFLDNDSYAWMAHTRDLMAEGGWRLRHTHMDNAPHGREMHWSHSLIWALQGMSSLIMAHTGWPAARAVELAGVWLMPVLLFLFLSIAFPFLARKAGWIPAALFCGFFLTVNGLHGAFHPLQPDHHGLQMIAILGMFACLQMGDLGRVQTETFPTSKPLRHFRSRSPCSLTEARGWFIASAACGAIAMWLGATVWLLSLAVIMVAAASGLLLNARSSPTRLNHPQLWRLWAWAGCLLSAVFYLIEYAPDHFGMRLEVNHPLYWLCWWGAGECLYTLSRRARWEDWTGALSAQNLLLLSGVIALLLAPALLLLGPSAWFSIKDPMMHRLHAHFIEEFQPAWAAIQAAPLRFFFYNLGVLPLALLVVPLSLLIITKDARMNVCARLVPTWVFSTLFFVMMLWQLRWGYFVTGALLWLATIWLPELHSHSRAGRQWARALALLLTINIGIAGGWRIYSERVAATADHVPPKWITSALAKRTVLRLGMAAGTNRWTMIGMATEAPTLYYFTGIRTVASYYWENPEGWHAETAFFADTSSASVALELTRERQFTHVFSRPDLMQPVLYNMLSSPFLQPLEQLMDTLAGQLSLAENAEAPSWIRFDPELSALTERMYAFRTSDGLVGESTTGHIFVLYPDDFNDHE